MSAPLAGVASATISAWVPPAKVGGDVMRGSIVAGVPVEVHEVGDSGWFVVVGYVDLPRGGWASAPMRWFDVIDVVDPAEGSAR